jgi:hypothetical protein
MLLRRFPLLKTRAPCSTSHGRPVPLRKFGSRVESSSAKERQKNLPKRNKYNSKQKRNERNEKRQPKRNENENSRKNAKSCRLCPLREMKKSKIYWRILTLDDNKESDNNTVGVDGSNRTSKYPTMFLVSRENSRFLSSVSRTSTFYPFSG